MHPDNYQSAAMRTKADPAVIASRFYGESGAQYAQFTAGVIGLTDEVGELASILKAAVEYGKGSVDVVHLGEEIGDCLWRLSQIADAFGISLTDCMKSNIDKLKVRYPDTYTDHLALNRTLEAERAVLEAFEQNGNGWAEPAESPEV